MFWSTYPVKLDDAKRFFLPSKFRDELADGLVMVKNQENCLSILPIAVANAQAERLLALPADSYESRAQQRMFTDDAYPATPDKQGRIAIPKGLCEWAQLDQDIVVRGVLDHVEIWNPAMWSAYRMIEGPKYATLNKPPEPPVATGT